MTSASTASRPELVCPAGTPAALRSAVDAGADCVYVGFRDETNARNFPGLNFSRKELDEAIGYAHGRGAKVLVAINTFPRAGAADLWHRAVDDAVGLGADALILADIGLIAYAAERHPEARLHLSVQAAASNPAAIRFYADRFGIRGRYFLDIWNAGGGCDQRGASRRDNCGAMRSLPPLAHTSP